MNKEVQRQKFEIVRISKIAIGVGVKENLGGAGFYSENICSTLYHTDNDEKDAAESEKWAKKICDALNNAAPYQSLCKELRDALEGLMEIGRKDNTNPKYDGYFNRASEVLTKASNILKS